MKLLNYWYRCLELVKSLCEVTFWTRKIDVFIWCLYLQCLNSFKNRHNGEKFIIHVLLVAEPIVITRKLWTFNKFKRKYCLPAFFQTNWGKLDASSRGSILLTFCTHFLSEDSLSFNWNFTNNFVEILLHIWSYSFCTEYHTLEHFAKMFLPSKVSKNYLRKSCSALTTKMLVRLAPRANVIKLPQKITMVVLTLLFLGLKWCSILLPF